MGGTDLEPEVGSKVWGLVGSTETEEPRCLMNHWNWYSDGRRGEDVGSVDSFDCRLRHPSLQVPDPGPLRPSLSREHRERLRNLTKKKEKEDSSLLRFGGLVPKIRFRQE